MATEKATENTTPASNSRVCELDCAPQLYKNDDESDVIECPAEKVSSTKCFLPRDLEEAFYEAVDWKKLAASHNDWMGYFVEDEINSDPFLAAKIKKAYKFGPIRGQRRFARVGFKIVENDGWKKCENMILKITLQPKGLRVQNLGHISLHPKKPVYHRDSARSRSGCGFYKREASTASSAACGEGDVEDSGPFHYKVDTLYWKQKNFCSEKNIPTVIFHVDPAKPGFFLENRINDLRSDINRHPVVIGEDLRKPTIPPGVRGQLKKEAGQAVGPLKAGATREETQERTSRLQKVMKEKEDAWIEEQLEKARQAEGSLATTEEEQRDLVNQIHKEIAQKFLRFWNRCIVKGKVRESNDYPGFNSSLRNAYRPAGPPCKAAPTWNTRKTPKQRSNRSSTRRSTRGRSVPTTRRSRKRASEEARTAWSPRSRHASSSSSSSSSSSASAVNGVNAPAEGKENRRGGGTRKIRRSVAHKHK